MSRILIILLSLLVTQAHGVTITFTGGGGDEAWANPDNWSTNTIPTVNDEVVIGGEAIVFIKTDTAWARSIEIKEGAQLHVLAKCIVRGGASLGLFGISMTEDAYIKLVDSLFVQEAGSDGIIMDQGALIQTGDGSFLSITDFAFNVNGKGFEMQTGTGLENQGTIEIRGAGNGNAERGIECDGQVENAGLLLIDDIHGNNQFGIESYGLFINEGQIIVDSVHNGHGIFVQKFSGSTGQLTHYGSIVVTNLLNTDKNGVHLASGAILTGDGDITCNRVYATNVSKIAPRRRSGSIGSLHINGDLHLIFDSSVQIQLGGEGGPGISNGHDWVHVQGDLIFQEAVASFSLLFGYLPEDHENFEFLTYSGVSGQFAYHIDAPGLPVSWAPEKLFGQTWVYRRDCGALNIHDVCGLAECPLYNGIYDATLSLIYDGPFVSKSDNEVWLRAPTVELRNEFEVELGSLFEIIPGGCNE